MAQQKSSLLDDIREGLSSSPAAQRLLEEAQGYLQARARNAVRATTEKVSGLSDRLSDVAENGGPPAGRTGAQKRAGKASRDGASESRDESDAGEGAGSSKVGEKVKGMLGGSSGSKTVSIMEQIDIGVARSVAYNQWTQFQEFGRFAKGVKSAEQQDETHVQWRAKIAFSTRTWKATITDQVPDERIAWRSEGEKGTVDGVVTFHELAPNLTRVLLDLEYHPHGLFEKTGNLWRAQGRRARLDLKKFRQFVMGEGEETGAWRGEVRDGKVVNSGDRKNSDRKNGGSAAGTSAQKKSTSSKPAQAQKKSTSSKPAQAQKKSTSSKPAQKSTPTKSAQAQKKTPSKSAQKKSTASKAQSSRPATTKRSSSASPSSKGKTTTNRRTTPKKTASRSTSTSAARRTRAKAGAGSK